MRKYLSCIRKWSQPKNVAISLKYVFRNTWFCVNWLATLATMLKISYFEDFLIMKIISWWDDPFLYVKWSTALCKYLICSKKNMQWQYTPYHGAKSMCWISLEPVIKNFTSFNHFRIFFISTSCLLCNRLIRRFFFLNFLKLSEQLEQKMCINGLTNQPIPEIIKATCTIFLSKE